MDIRIPHLGEGADSGNVVNVLVKPGDKVTKDQTLIELENEKAVAPIPSTHAGVVQKIYVKTGDKVTVGQAIVALGEEGASFSAPSAAPSEKKAPESAHHPIQTPPPAMDEDYSYSSKSGFAPPASPTVRKLAMELGIDLARVRGSEPGGRIVVGDLRNYIQYLQQSASQPRAATAELSKPAAAPAEQIDFSKWGTVNKKPASSLRQKIGQKMLESWTTIPHVTQFDEADVTALMTLRKKQGLTVTPFILKALVTALKKFPLLNSSLDETTHEIVYKEYYHIGVAVDTDAGLIVPVLRDVDKKSVSDLAKELDTLAEKTRQRKVSIDELKGGSFTLSNLGGVGGTFFTPIINKPEVAILGVGRGVLKPVVTKDKNIEPRMMMPLGLSYDHRVVDGADGARFIREVVANLENFKDELK